MLAAYLRQRIEVGEGRIVLEAAAHPRPAADTPPREATDGLREEGASSGVEAAEPAWRRGAPEIPPPGLVIPAPSNDVSAAALLADRSLAEVAGLICECAKCGLCQGRKQAVPGEGPPDARLMVVGEGPGATEDETGRPFVGRAGDLLTEILAAIEYPREKVFICNIVKCRPPGNRVPQPEEIDACVPYLYRQIDLVRPAVILAMGGTAAVTLLHTKQSLGALRERVHSFRGIPLVVTYHPAALLRNPLWKKPTWDDVRIARRLLGDDR